MYMNNAKFFDVMTLIIFIIIPGLKYLLIYLCYLYISIRKLFLEENKEINEENPFQYWIKLNNLIDQGVIKVGNVKNNQETDKVKRLHIAPKDSDTTHRLRQHGEHQQDGGHKENDRGKHTHSAVINLIHDKHTYITEQKVLQMLQNHIAAHTIHHDDRNSRQEYHHYRNDIVRFQLDFSQKGFPRGVNIGFHDNDEL